LIQNENKTDGWGKKIYGSSPFNFDGQIVGSNEPPLGTNNKGAQVMVLELTSKEFGTLLKLLLRLHRLVLVQTNRISAILLILLGHARRTLQFKILVS